MCFYKLDPNTFEGPFKRSTCLRYLIQWNPLKLEYIIYEIFLLIFYDSVFCFWFVPEKEVFFLLLKMNKVNQDFLFL